MDGTLAVSIVMIKIVLGVKDAIGTGMSLVTDVGLTLGDGNDVVLKTIFVLVATLVTEIKAVLSRDKVIVACIEIEDVEWF